MKVLLTGGTGYIGSHTAVVLIEAGFDVVLLDNLSNSSESVVDKIELITKKRPFFVEADVRNIGGLKKIFNDIDIDIVIHFAGLKSVNESLEMPLSYFDNNVSGTINLLTVMNDHDVKNLVFSSSATVYGNPAYLPIDEKHSTGALNPYGQTKLHIEQMLYYQGVSDPDWRISTLRYFNPVGAHESGLIGENPIGKPNNLMPYISKVAAKSLPLLYIFGNDYDTEDGTGVRDYLHVMDLADGHLAAVRELKKRSSSYEIFNLGTGLGTSVTQLVNIFKETNNVDIPVSISSRRSGDVSSCYADASKANHVLGWSARRNVYDMCASAWRFVQK